MSGRWRVGVVGPGRAGTVVAAALARGGHRVVAVAGGAASSQDRLVSRLPGARVVAIEDLVAAGVDLVVLAAPDRALPEVVARLAAAGPGEGRRAVHLSGASGLALLAPLADGGWRTAATHPAVTFPDPMGDPATLVGQAWGVTCAPDDRSWAHELVTATGGDAVDVAEVDRPAYHAALAIASNAVGAAVAAAADVLRGAGVAAPERFVAPLADASRAAALAGGAAAVTGPVVRGDLATLRRHADVLDGRDRAAWAAAMRLVLAVVAPRLDGTAAAAIADLLDDDAR